MIAAELETELRTDIEKCIFFSLQLDESTDLSDTSQLAITIKMVFNDFSTKEEFLKVLPMKERTRGQDIFDVVKKYLVDIKIPFKKLSSITTDGAPAMTGKNVGFIALCKQDPEFPTFISYHCIIHQQNLCSKIMGFEHVISIVAKMINSIVKSSAQQHRQFKLLLEENESEFSDLCLYTEVRWLSKGKTLQRFIDLLPEVKEFLNSRGKTYQQLDDKTWLCDIGFLTDMTTKLNDLNTKLQGMHGHIGHTISAVNAFKGQLKLLKTHLAKNSLTHFPKLKKIVENKNIESSYFTKYSKIINKLADEFSDRFIDFSKLEPVVNFFLNPFNNCNLENTNIAVIISNYFQLKTMESLEMEIIAIQADLILKAHCNDITFWRVVDKVQYPILTECALKIFSYTASTYNCECLFSNMTFLKSKYRNRLTDEHLDNCLRGGNSNYILDYNKLAEKMQNQLSH